MTYKAKLKVQFDTEWTPSPSGIYDDETLPEEHYTFEIPTEDINSTQLFRFFENVARVMGHSDIGIMKGACHLAFNDMRSEEEMRKVADEFDLVMSEDVAKKINEAVKQEKLIDTEWARINAQSHAIVKLRQEVYDLRAKLSRYENPDNPNYTEEELDAMMQPHMDNT